MRARCILPYLSAVFAAITVSSSLAQTPLAPPAEPSVAVTGTATLKRPAELLRLRVEIQTKGKDLTEALATLKERRTAARTQLVALGAAEAAVKFGEPKITAAATNQQQQMARMVRERMGGGATSRPSATAAKPEPVLVSLTLTAEWPLTGDAEAQLVFTHELESKIKAADLSGAKETAGLSPEEQEQLEEMEGMSRSGEYDQRAKPGEPLLLYVGKVTDAERKKLLAEAFQKAQAEAARLAEIAGATVGRLGYLSGDVSGDENNRFSRYNSSYDYAMQQALAREETVPGEVIATEPGPLTFRATVSATYALAGLVP